MNNKKSCPNCGTQFDGRSNRTYCSSRCKTQAFRISKSQEETRPVIKPVPVTPPIQPVVPRLDKTAVEVERLRLLNAERIKEMEYKELDRQRQFEADQKKRKFEEERQREEWRSDSVPPVSDPSPILQRLDELSNQLVSLKAHEQEDAEEDNAEEDNTSGGWETPVLIVGGLILGALFLAGNGQPPTKPIIRPKSVPFPTMPKPPITDSETTQ